MTDEELKYYKALQPLFKERMGEWQIGDHYTISNKIRVIESSDFGLKDEFIYEDIDGCLRLPLPIDPRNPERGLWGMVDKTRYRIDLHHLGATVTQMYSRDGCIPFDMKTFDTPTLALLKALAHQEEVTV